MTSTIQYLFAEQCFGRSEQSTQRSGPWHNPMELMEGPRKQPPTCRHPPSTAIQAEKLSAGTLVSRT
jgi:hypothetical protein